VRGKVYLQMEASNDNFHSPAETNQSCTICVGVQPRHAAPGALGRNPLMQHGELGWRHAAERQVVCE